MPTMPTARALSATLALLTVLAVPSMAETGADPEAARLAAELGLQEAADRKSVV